MIIFSNKTTPLSIICIVCSQKVMNISFANFPLDSFFLPQNRITDTMQIQTA